MLPPPAWVLRLEVPKPTPYPFEAVFGNVEQVTSDALKRFSQLRDEVAGAIAKSAADAGIMVCRVKIIEWINHTNLNLFAGY